MKSKILVAMEQKLALWSVIYAVCFDDMNNLYSLCTKPDETAGDTEHSVIKLNLPRVELL